MSVRLRLALTVLFTGLATALGVLVAVALAFERFEREASYARADQFLGRVLALHDDLPAQQRRDPAGFAVFLRSLLLLEPASQLYLLAPDGTVLSSSGDKRLPPGFQVAIGPVREAAAFAAAAAAAAAAAVAASGASHASGAPAAASARRSAYVMGDDPEYMDEGTVVAARALSQPTIHAGAQMAGYLYIVCRKPGLPPSRVARLAEHLAGPALWPVLAVVLLASLLAAWIIGAVTRPLAVLSHGVAEAARAGLDGEAASFPGTQALAHRSDEFGRLHQGFQTLLAKLRAQWAQLQRLDAFRRESVSNLSHDLRSPLTAAAASLETLQQRWQAAAQRQAVPGGVPRAATERLEDAAEDARLVAVALRNTHNAARLVRSLGDLAVLDEARFKLRLAHLDLAEVLDDITMRFAERAARQGVALVCELAGAEPLAATVDVELIERAIANLLDNALGHTARGGRIVLAARWAPGTEASAAPAARHVRVTVRDNGRGIAPDDLTHLFDRHFRGAGPAGPASRADGGKGLGLAIVQRIVELHGGQVSVHSELGVGTEVTLELPQRPAESAH